MKKIKCLALFTMLALCIVSAINAEGINDEQRVYMDDSEIEMQDDAFHVHIGNNVWLVTESVENGTSDMNTREFNISKSISNSNEMAYQKCWKCPYCHNYWPIGKACQNPNCASKYKDSRRK